MASLSMRQVHLLILLLVCFPARAPAQNLSWDAGSHRTNSGLSVVAASGNWNATALNWVNGILTCCDGDVECFQFDAALTAWQWATNTYYCQATAR